MRKKEGNRKEKIMGGKCTPVGKMYSLGENVLPWGKKKKKEEEEGGGETWKKMVLGDQTLGLSA